MDSGLQRKKAKKFSTKTILISVLGLTLIMSAITIQIAYTVLKYDKIYNGIYVSNLHIGDMSKEEASTFLNQNLKSDIGSIEISINTDIESETFKYSDIGAFHDIPEVVDKAFKIGRSGAMFQRLKEIINTRIKGEKICLSISYDGDKLKTFVDQIYNRTLIPKKEIELIELENQLILKSGTTGQGIDKEDLLNRLKDSIQECKKVSLEAQIIEIHPKNVDIEGLHAEINQEPLNANFKLHNSNIIVIPHQKGRKLAKDYLTNLEPSLSKNEGQEFILPVEYINPQITTDIAQNNLFKDTLSLSSSNFSTSNQNNKNRAENIKKSLEKINGLVLCPGDIFSFNDVVGPRTKEAGYKSAHAYAAGKVVESFGGGICQSSSTLYNSVLLADLNVTERVNHMFTVSYVPYGRDATVSYGQVDFKFKNSFNWPIKIEAWIEENRILYFRIKGTNENPEKKVEYAQNIIKTIDFTTNYIDDPNIDEGINIVKQNGSKGYVVETYKIVKQGENIISKNKLHTSSYSPLYQEIIRGTKKGDMEAPVDNEGNPLEKVPQIEDPPIVSGIDDAQNPPAILEDEIDKEKEIDKEDEEIN